MTFTNQPPFVTDDIVTANDLNAMWDYAQAPLVYAVHRTGGEAFDGVENIGGQLGSPTLFAPNKPINMSALKAQGTPQWRATLQMQISTVVPGSPTALGATVRASVYYTNNTTAPIPAASYVTVGAAFTPENQNTTAQRFQSAWTDIPVTHTPDGVLAYSFAHRWDRTGGTGNGLLFSSYSTIEIRVV